MNLYLSTCDYIFWQGPIGFPERARFCRKKLPASDLTAFQHRETDITFGIVLGMVFFLSANL